MRLIFCSLLFWVHTAQAQTPLEVVTQIQNRLSPKNSKTITQFTSYRSDGTTNTYEVYFTSKDPDHGYGYFMKPEREKGREILRIEDILWTFIPSVGRAVRVADRDSFAGGDFSNADVLRIDWVNQYRIELMKETTNQWILDLIAKTPDTAYAKMRLWVDKKNGQPVQQQFYDSKGTLLKRCLYGSIKTFGSITRPSRLVMENLITSQKSEMQLLSVEVQLKIPESRFYVDSLGK